MNSFKIPRRLLMTTDTVGGIWNYALELSRGLGAHGIEVVLATMGPRAQPEQRAQVATLSNVTLEESDYRLEWMEAPWDDVTAASTWLLTLERQYNPDLIHLNGYAHGALAWQAPVLVTGHSCVLSWWRSVYDAAPPPEWNRYRETVRSGIQAAGLVVAPSHAMLEMLTQNYGPLRTSEVIYNGRDPLEFAPGTKENLVLSVGRWWDRAKNAALLAAVAPRLGWPVRLIGNNRPPEGGSHRNRSALVSGPLPPVALADLYARAGIYALPARYEPFGLSVLEAAMAGCALVLGDIPSLREIWHGAALFVFSEEPSDLEEAINTLIADSDLRRDLARRARERAAQFTAERMVSGYLSAYGRCLESVARVSAAPFPA